MWGDGMGGEMRNLLVALAAFAGIHSAQAASIGDLTQPSSAELSTASGVKSMDAEVCHSIDGRYILARGFEQSVGLFIDLSEKPEPKPREGYRYEKLAGGFTVKNPVEADMFELMAETFDGVAVPQALWAGTYEVRFEGKVQIMDPQGQTVADVEVTCSAALLEYN